MAARAVRQGLTASFVSSARNRFEDWEVASVAGERPAKATAPQRSRLMTQRVIVSSYTVRVPAAPEPEEIRERCDRGLDSLRSRLRTPGDERQQQLADLLGFREAHVGWAKTDRQGNFVPLGAHPERPPKDRAWFLAYSWDDPAARALLAAFSTHRIGDGRRIAIHCQPQWVTPIWTAILICHEVEHLEAGWSGREPLPRPWTHYYQGERAAYELQRAAADVLTEGGFSEQVSRFARLEQVRWWELAGAAARHELVPPLAPLAKVLTAEAPQSEAEAGLRAAFLIVALSFAAIEAEFAELEEAGKEKDQFLRALLPRT